MCYSHETKKRKLEVLLDYVLDNVFLSCLFMFVVGAVASTLITSFILSQDRYEDIKSGYMVVDRRVYKISPVHSSDTVEVDK